MTAELTTLILAALLLIVQMLPVALLGRAQVPPDWHVSPRDEPVTLSGRAGRAQRAFQNHFEGLVLFAIACLTLTLADKTTGLTASLAWIYLAARVLYVPAYIYGLSPWRSLVWAAGFLATLAILILALI